MEVVSLDIAGGSENQVKNNNKRRKQDIEVCNAGVHALEGEKPSSSVRLPAPKSPGRENKKLGEDIEASQYSERSTGSPSPPLGSYGGYHLSYEVKKLM